MLVMVNRYSPFTSNKIAPNRRAVSVKCWTSSASNGLPKTFLSRWESHFIRTW